MDDYFSASVDLKLKPFRTGIASLLHELADKKVLEEEFLVDPAGFLAERLHPALKNLPRHRLNDANRFLFSVLANDRFRGWQEQYQQKLQREYDADPTMVIDHAAIRRDLATAMLEYGDAAILEAILPGRAASVARIPDSLVERYVLESPFSDGESHSSAVIIEVLIQVVVTVTVFTAVSTVTPTVVLVGATAPGQERMASAILRAAAITPRELGNISEQLVATAKKLRAQQRI